MKIKLKLSLCISSYSDALCPYKAITSVPPLVAPRVPALTPLPPRAPYAVGLACLSPPPRGTRRPAVPASGSLPLYAVHCSLISVYVYTIMNNEFS